MHEIINSLIEIISSLGYIWVFLGMLLESTFIPVPSEVIMIPAGYLASTGEMSIILLFILWTIWACVGASINYFLWKYLWAPVVYKLIKNYGKYFLVSEKHYLESEVFFQKHGNIATFTGRLLPGIRHLISIPAGVFHMKFKPFILYTFFGAALWNIILIAIGYIAGENKELIEQYGTEVTFWIFVSVACVIIVYIYLQKKSKK